MAKKKLKKIPKSVAKAKKKAKVLASKKPAKKIVKKVLKKKPVKNTVKKIGQKPQESSFSNEALFRARIKVIGIGGGGGSIVSEIGRYLEKATFVVADTDVRSIRKRPGIKYLLFGESFTHGLGAGLNVDLAKSAAVSAKEKMSQLIKDQDIVVFVASLGGGVGSGATEVFAQAAKEFGGITLGIFTLPFKFEGANKQNIARNTLKNLRQSLNVSLVIPNEKIFKIIDEQTPITEAFSMVNRRLIESLESLIDLIYSPGIINIDFADLRTVLSGLGNTGFLNTVVASGKDRADKICQTILQNPLLQNTAIESEKILLNIAGSASLSMMEVEKISRHVSEVNPKAKIIFGISKNAKLNNKIKATILMTGGGSKEVVAPATVEKPVAAPKLSEAKAAPVKAKTKPKKVSKPKPVAPETKPNNTVPIKKPKEEIPVVPVFQPIETPAEAKLSVIQTPKPSKPAIRRSALEIKKAEELEEKRREDQEKEWEIPAFLRKIKYKS